MLLGIEFYTVGKPVYFLLISATFERKMWVEQQS